MKEVTDEQIYQKLNTKSIESLEYMARRLHISAIPYRRFARKEDLVDAVWFSIDNEFTRERLVSVLFGRKHAKHIKKRKKVHIIKKHIIRIKYRIHHHLGRKRNEKKRQRRTMKKAGITKKKTAHAEARRKKRAVPRRIAGIKTARSGKIRKR